MKGRMSPRSTPLPESFVVRPLASDGSLGPRWDMRSDFAERFWLPRIGPTSFLAARRLTKGLAGRAGIRVNSVELSRALGLGGGLGNSAPLTKSLNRLSAFGLGHWDGDTLSLCREVRPISHVGALPEHLQGPHDRTVAATWDQHAAAAATRSAIAIGSGLVDGGAELLAVEESLRVQGFEIGVVGHALDALDANRRLSTVAGPVAVRPADRVVDAGAR